jgi:hypothetical protein
LLLSILAVVAAAFMPLAATSQLLHHRGAAPPDNPEPTYKYEVMAGYGYTSLNQVISTRNGLQGVNVSVTRDWGKYFGLTADGGFYKFPYDAPNPGNPTVDMFLVGPVVHAHLYKQIDLLARVLLGVEHTGGEPGGTPVLSFAAGFGVGADYKLSQRFFLRASGDDIISSYGEDPDHLGNSAHTHRNARAAFGVVYKF